MEGVSVGVTTMLFSVPLGCDSFSDATCLWQPWHLEDFRLGVVKNIPWWALFNFLGLDWGWIFFFLEKDYRDSVTLSRVLACLLTPNIDCGHLAEGVFWDSSTVEILCCLLHCPYPQDSSRSTPIANHGVMKKKQAIVLGTGSHVAQAAPRLSM